MLTSIGRCGPCGANALSAGPTNAQAWPAANDAIYVPIRVREVCTVYRMSCGTGTATTGNFDLGLYDWSGNRLVSTGSTAKTTASAERLVDVTDTTILPGRYYLAMAVDTNAAAYVGVAVGANGRAKLLGMRSQATAFALPSSATFATCTAIFVPYIAAHVRSES